MKKHTPGPWNVSESMNGTLQPFDAKGRHLLSCEAEKPLPLAVRQANGRLMAAAPHLLAAVTQAKLDLIDYSDNPAISRIIDTLTHAITKATRT